MSFLMEEADIELCGDDTILETASYGEAGGDVNGRAKNNPGVTK